MLLYNTTFAVDIDIEKDVIQWIEDVFIPSAVEDSCFFSPQILRVLGGEPEVTSIAVHIYTDSIKQIENWYADHGSALFGSLIERWDGKVVIFSTTLQVIYG